LTEDYYLLNKLTLRVSRRQKYFGEFCN